MKSLIVFMSLCVNVLAIEPSAFNTAPTPEKSFFVTYEVNPPEAGIPAPETNFFTVAYEQQPAEFGQYPPRPVQPVQPLPVNPFEPANPVKPDQTPVQPEKQVAPTKHVQAPGACQVPQQGYNSYRGYRETPVFRWFRRGNGGLFRGGRFGSGGC